MTKEKRQDSVLSGLRKRIDGIDEKILELLNSRAREVVKINNVKEKKNLSTYAPDRETTMLKRLKNLNRGPFGSQDVENVFREILSVCRSQRSRLRIAYFGPEGTFTHLATIKKFGKKPEYLPLENIADVFDKVERDEADYGVVPIENSTEGVVNYTLDMFFASQLRICAEVTLNVSHALLSGTSSGPIERVYSHPQVFAQCRQWLLRSLPAAKLITVSSTASAAQRAARDRRGACIGNRILANLYGLRVRASSIEDYRYNYTRFLIIAKNDSPSSGSDKTSILFSIKDKVGALYDVLSSFKRYNINLTKIESRPSKRKPWDYYFFIDFEGHRSSPSVEKALHTIEKACVFVKVLGSYPKES